MTGDEIRCDLLVVGAGTAGIPAAIFAAEAGASVVVVEAADVIGGTLHLSNGQISAAGTSVQASKGIDDDAERHFADIMRISRATADPAVLRLAVTHAADTLHWLMREGLEIPDAHPVLDPANELYTIPRTYWHPEGGQAILRAIRPAFDRHVNAGRIRLYLSTRLDRLNVGNDGEDGGGVTGGSIEGAHGRIAVHARATLLASGGFTANPTLFAALTGGKPLYGSGYPQARGQGLEAALAIGGTVVNREKFLPTFAPVEDPDARDGYGFATHTYPQQRQPWEVYVDRTGRRFMREDDPDLNGRQRALRAAPGMQFWAIYDARTERDAPPLFRAGSWDAMDHRFAARSPGFVEAGSLAGLADVAGLDPPALAETVAVYNAALKANVPDPFGRRHRPAPISEPRFRAVRHSGWSPTAFAGLGVDGTLRVVDGLGRPIAGLYAAGELLGMAATGGQAFCSGMSVGPALTFGRLLGQRLGGALAAR